MKHLNFCVDEDFFKRVKIDAVKKGFTIKQYLNEAVKLYLKEKETKD